jgi:hypothetical protein
MGQAPECDRCGGEVVEWVGRGPACKVCGRVPPAAPAGKAVDYLAGLDLGQRADFTAFCAVRRAEAADPSAPGRVAWRYDVVALRRFPLGTPYPGVVAAVAGWMGQAPLAGAPLAVDQTGVGAAVVDLFRQAPGAPWLVPVLVTAGHQVTAHEGGGYGVPKKELVGVLQALLGSRRLAVAGGLPETPALVRELETFTAKVTAAGHETLEAWRERDHDDLVLAVALACWAGENLFGYWPRGACSTAGDTSLISKMPPGVFPTAGEGDGPAGGLNPPGW